MLDDGETATWSEEALKGLDVGRSLAGFDILQDIVAADDIKGLTGQVFQDLQRSDDFGKGLTVIRQQQVCLRLNSSDPVFLALELSN